MYCEAPIGLLSYGLLFCISSNNVKACMASNGAFDIRKQLAESLILSKIDYNDIVSNPIPEYLLKRLQRAQLAAAGFLLGRYARVR